VACRAYSGPAFVWCFGPLRGVIVRLISHFTLHPAIHWIGGCI